MKKELQKIYKHEMYKYKKVSLQRCFLGQLKHLWLHLDSNFGGVFNLNPPLLVLRSEVKCLFSSEELRRKLNILYSLNFQLNLNFWHSNCFKTGFCRYQVVWPILTCVWCHSSFIKFVCMIYWRVDAHLWIKNLCLNQEDKQSRNAKQ